MYEGIQVGACIALPTRAAYLQQGAERLAMVVLLVRSYGGGIQEHPCRWALYMGME